MELKSISSEYLALFSVAVIVAGVGITTAPSGNSPQDSDLEWDNTITIEKNGVQIAQFHNNLTDQGKNYIAGELFGDGPTDAKTSTNNFEFISLGVAYSEENVIIGNTEHVPNEYVQYNLTRKKANTKSYSSGTYTLEKEFTANFSSEHNYIDSAPAEGEKVPINVTGLNYGNNDPGTPRVSGDAENQTLVSGGTFNSAGLMDGDKLTVTHEITIKDG